MKHIKLESTKRQRLNLLKLAKYLTTVEENKFDMSDYMSKEIYGHKLSLTITNQHNRLSQCGTVACAAGHGVAAGVKIGNALDWSHYVAINFLSSDKLKEKKSDYAFDFLFTSNWARTDNTPLGAAKRIAYALKFGVPIEHCFKKSVYAKKFTVKSIMALTDADIAT